MTEHTTRPIDGAAGESTPPGYQGLGTIVGNIASDVSDLVRQEAELAKVELKSEAAKASKAAGLFGGAGAAAHIAAVFLTLALALGLADWFDLDLGWTTFIVGVLWTLLALVLFTVAKNRMKAVDPVPHQTIKTIKEGL